MLSTVAGLHVPLIPLVDEDGNTIAVAPSHMDTDVPKLNTGVIIGFTVTLSCTGVAQGSAGVNV